MANDYELTFRRRYNLPPTDDRFLNATREDIITDYWANFFTENPNVQEVEDEEYNVDDEIRKMEQGDCDEVT